MAPVPFSGWFLLLVLVVSLSLFCLLRALAAIAGGTDRRHWHRTRSRLQQLKGLGEAQAEETVLKSFALRRSLLDQILKGSLRVARLRILLLQADVHWREGALLLVTILLGGLGLVLGYLQWGLWVGLAGAALGLLLPYRILLWKKKRRTMKFERQLPDALDLLARSLKAGHAFPTGLQLVAREMPDPIGTEFFKTFNEFSHGMDLNLAMANLCHRVDLRDLGFFTTAVAIQRETGGNLTEILEKIATLIRERFKLRQQVQSLTAEGRLSGIILVLLPPVLTLILFVVNPQYEILLITHPLGRMMTLTTLAFQVLGIIIIRRIVNIKV